MNRNVCLFMVFMIVLSVNVSAVYRLFDHFEDKFLTAINGQDSWFAASGDNRVVEDPANSTNQVLYIPSESSVIRKPLAAEHTGILDGTSRMMFMRMRISQKQTFSVGLSFSTYPSQSDDFTIEIAMSNSAENLDLKVWDDDGSNYKELTQLTADHWYNMWIWIDAEANTYEIWMNDVEGADADPAADKLKAADEDDVFLFRSGKARDLVTFFIKTAGGSSGTNFGPMYFDDIYLELSSDFNLANPTTIEEPIPGDADLSGCVNLVDFAAVSAAWLAGPVPAADWQDGNFDYDDAVNLVDLALLAEHWLAGCFVQ